ncbi:MAG TPA: hypothetical protein DCK76_01620 [Desulfotomaculum sp.]|nr:hypothetical protein [Desulfotomaculum sp.]HBY04440.1 hypothetical protein [Desulfotomaculum sp.]
MGSKEAKQGAKQNLNFLNHIKKGTKKITGPPSCLRDPLADHRTGKHTWNEHKPKKPKPAELFRNISKRAEY